MQPPKPTALHMLLSICALLGSIAQAQSTGQNDLHINVLGLQNNQGQVVANLFEEGADVFGKPHTRQIQTIAERKAVVTFRNVVDGRSALIVFHDVNGNNDLDHSFLRLPVEPLGLSNGFELTLVSGMPSFRKLAFTAGPETKPLEITVK